MQSYQLSVSNGHIFVRQWGQDHPLLIFLPGYGYEGSVVEPMLPALTKCFTVCAIDLPFHGQSQWATSFFSKSDMQHIISQLTQRLGQQRFSLAGHSLGGRIALVTAPQFAEDLEHIFLLAPAGIGRYTFALPRFLQRLVELAIQQPSWLKYVINTGHRLGLVSNFHRRYAEVNIYPEEARYRLFRVWNSLPGFQPERTVERLAFQSLPTPTVLILGKRDRVIPNEEVIQYFQTKQHLAIAELDAGHELYLPSVATRMIEMTK